ncbi:hypothetical protein MSAN_01142300 [Mycena sanguinolenta]|uniref:PIN domain-containing protein n=1 Tax=Mycena sanguinolenta TaxID=230812 RepID=A0A8H7D6F8_9AGAR|nr:hypothetical protein MSAN_01142300 [Mycena sanguinolenta]
MSRALGAAFLNHQVEQLEKSAANANANWRTRPQPPASPKRVQQPKRASQQQQRNSNGVNGQRRSFDDPKASEKDGGKTSHSNEKDANIIVIDASVLIHALPAVRFWVHEGRTEILIVPLEALNTLDMLKKGTSALAQRALAASRVLEAQVGVNGRVRVQRDEAFVLWDAIRFADPIEVEDATKGEEGNMVPALPDDPDTAPEWVRRTVCCARYEVDNAIAASPTTTTTTTTAPTATPAGAPGAPASAPSASPAVVLAVLVPSPDTARPLSAGDAAQNKHEPRATGTLVAHWAARAGVAVKGVPAAAPNPNVANANASSAGATSVGANVGANAGGGAGAGWRRRRCGWGTPAFEHLQLEARRARWHRNWRQASPRRQRWLRWKRKSRQAQWR